MVKIKNYTFGQVVENGYIPLILETDLGYIRCRYYSSAHAQGGVIFVGGIGGGFDTPAYNLYPKLAKTLTQKGISGLRVEFRFPTNLEESVQDVLSGTSFLEIQGIKKIGLVGHSFGGAVIIQAAAQTSLVKTVVTLATQLHGAEAVTEFKNTSILFIHGQEDQVLSPHNSEIVFNLAHEPKSLSLINHASNSLNETADQVYQQVLNWLTTHL